MSEGRPKVFLASHFCFKRPCCGVLKGIFELEGTLHYSKIEAYLYDSLLDLFHFNIFHELNINKISSLSL